MNLSTPSHPQRARSHGRSASGDERRRVAIPRRSTRGPLDSDVDDPLADTTQPAATATATPQPNPIPNSSSHRVLSPTHSDATNLPSNDAQLPDMPEKDFSFIQDASAYHVLPASNIPPPFLNAPTVPPVSSPIDSLLAAGHYRLAAIAAARNIVTAASPTDHDSLFHLLHIRLACLCLIHEHALAAQESKVLGDLNSAFYLHPLTNAHLVPWDLRLLVVRLAALGYGEWRKGIMGYYELAREAREHIVKSETDEENTLWRSRLRDCGVRVANVLVEMGDLEGAGRHLASLSMPGTPTDSLQARDIIYMEALIWLRVGDIRTARICLSRAEEGSSDALLDGTLKALAHLAESDYLEAVSALRTLHEQFPSNPMVTQNLAVCLLYTGHISDARTLLSDLVDTTPPFHSLIFNLSTIYELCTERNRDRKVALAEKLASRQSDGTVGWEIASADFKL